MERGGQVFFLFVFGQVDGRLFAMFDLVLPFFPTPCQSGVSSSPC